MSRLAIIAGQGAHPLKLAHAVRADGIDPYIILLAGQADADFTGFDTASYPVGKIGHMVEALKEAECDRLVMAGKVTRPPLSQLKLDAVGMKLISSLLFAGDNSILERLKLYLRDQNITVEDADLYLPRHKLPTGYHFGAELTDTMRNDIALGVTAMRQMDGLDIGQGLVIQAGRILAIEGAEGTDALLARTASLIDPDATPAIFVKMSKYSQDKTQDAPSFGIQTIGQMAEAGIYFAAFEAEQCRSLESITEIEAKAKISGITLTAIAYEPE